MNNNSLKFQINCLRNVLTAMDEFINKKIFKHT